MKSRIFPFVQTSFFLLFSSWLISCGVPVTEKAPSAQMAKYALAQSPFAFTVAQGSSPYFDGGFIPGGSQGSGSSGDGGFIGGSGGPTGGNNGDGGKIGSTSSGSTGGNSGDGGKVGSASSGSTGGNSGDGGLIGGTGGSSGGDGGLIQSVTFNLRRVCWIHSPFNDKLNYFEKATRPILTIQVQPPAAEGKTASPLVVGMQDLSGVDLFNGPYSGTLNINLTQLQQAYPTNWASMPVTVRVCDDPNGTNVCGAPGTKNVSNGSGKINAASIPAALNVAVWFGSHIAQDQATLKHYCDARDPLVLDLTGRGIQLSGPTQGVSFDLYDTGMPVTTGWVASSNAAFLARDLNNNGRIDSGAELFGSATLLPDGNRATDGFEALRALDSDGDGQITPHDAAWSELLLWSDANFNGVTDPGELKHLDEMGIESISLQSARMWAVDDQGNETTARSTYLHFLGGRSVASLIFDVWFNVFLP